MSSRLRVIVIGGSATASALIADFVSRPCVHVVGVADPDPESEAAIAAFKFGIFFTTDISDFSAMNPWPDLVLDVSHDAQVNLGILETFPPPHAGGPSIVHDTVARLVLMLAADTATQPVSHAGAHEGF